MTDTVSDRGPADSPAASGTPFGTPAAHAGPGLGGALPPALVPTAGRQCLAIAGQLPDFVAAAGGLMELQAQLHPTGWLTAHAADATALPWPVHTLPLRSAAPGALETEAASALRPLLRVGDVLLAPWRMNATPEDGALGRAAARAAREAGAVLVEVPVGRWLSPQPGDPRFPWARARRIPLDAATVRRKRDWVAALFPDREQPPVRTYEVVLLPLGG